MSSPVRLSSDVAGRDPLASGGPTTAVVDIDVARGGRIVQISVGDVTLLVDPPAFAVPDPAAADERPAEGGAPDEAVVPPTAWGCYPMAPWAGRVRDGRFRYFDADHRLRLNHDDSGRGAVGRQHAMHGTVLDAVWTPDEQHESVVSMSCPLDQPGSGWPFGGTAHQRIELSPHQLRCDLSVQVDAWTGSPDQRFREHLRAGTAPSFPAEIGWHPWWRKPDALTFHPDAMYERDVVGLPTGRLVAPTAGPWDDCFVNTAPVTLHYERASVREVTIGSDCDHWVVYDMPDDATCVEPQSGPPDAFNLGPQIVTGTHPLRRTMTVSW